MSTRPLVLCYQRGFTRKVVNVAANCGTVPMSREMDSWPVAISPNNLSWKLPNPNPHAHTELIFIGFELPSLLRLPSASILIGPEPAQPTQAHVAKENEAQAQAAILE